MSEEVIIKKKKVGRPKGSGKKPKKKVDPKAPKNKGGRPKKPIIPASVDEEGKVLDIPLEEMNSEELDNESKRALIKQREAQAAKQTRLNEIAEGRLVERNEVIDIIKGIVFGAVEVLDLFPDQVGPLLHKKTQKQIREKLVQNVDKVKAKWINLLMEFDDE